jgi:uncharacterized protein YutE (UPF0331/DUF86 family)
VNNVNGALARLLSFIDEQLVQLTALSRLDRSEFEESETLRLIAERRLEITAQACLDVAHRILASSGSEGMRAGAEAVEEIARSGIVPVEFARTFKRIAQFRNVLAHMYVEIDWDLVYANLQRVDEIGEYAEYIRAWLRDQATEFG